MQDDGGSVQGSKTMSLGKEAKKGVFYIFLSKYSDVVFQLLITAVLARLLTPEEFGIFAIIIVIVNLSRRFTEIGLKPAIVQYKDLSEDEIGSIFNFTILQGLAFAVVFYFIVSLLKVFFDNPAYLDYRIWVAVIVFLGSLNIVPSALLSKAVNFRVLGFTRVIGNLLSGALGIVLAYHKFGVFALIYRRVLLEIMTFGVLFITSKMRYVFNFDFSWFRKIGKFAFNQFGYSIVNYLWRNIDNFLIAKFFNEAALGIYSRAYSLMRYPVRYLSYALTPVLHPVLSKVQNDKDRIRTFYMKFTKLMSLVALPLIVVMYLLARDIILILFGNQWVDSILLFKYLSIASGLLLFKTTTAPIFYSIGRTDVLFRLGIFEGVVTVLGIVIGLHWGVLGVAVGYMIANVITFVPLYAVLFKMLDGTFFDFLKSVRHSFLLSVLLLAVLLISLNLIQIDSLVLHFFVFTGIGVAAYAGLIFIFRLNTFIFKVLKM